jgi:DNA-binding response OmpR family regulator
MNIHSANYGGRILVLEDDLLLAMDMEDFLSAQGFEVVGPYGKISQAIEAIAQQPIDFAVVDLNLNGEMSFPVIDVLQKQSIPLIVCSGYAELPEVKAELADLPLLPKPWSPRKLSNMIADVFVGAER